MKGLKEFLEALKKDEGLRAEVEKVQDDAKKVVDIAKQHGYSFTEDEFNDLKMEAVSGGAITGQQVAGFLQKAASDPNTKNLIDKGLNYAQNNPEQLAKLIDFGISYYNSMNK